MDMDDGAVIRWIEGLTDLSVLAALSVAVERRLAALDVCEHGVPTPDYCEACREEYRWAMEAHEQSMGGQS